MITLRQYQEHLVILLALCLVSVAYVQTQPAPGVSVDQSAYVFCIALVTECISHLMRHYGNVSFASSFKYRAMGPLVHLARFVQSVEHGLCERCLRTWRAGSPLSSWTRSSRRARCFHIRHNCIMATNRDALLKTRLKGSSWIGMAMFEIALEGVSLRFSPTRHGVVHA